MPDSDETWCGVASAVTSCNLLLTPRHPDFRLYHAEPFPCAIERRLEFRIITQPIEARICIGRLDVSRIHCSTKSRLLRETGATTSKLKYRH